MPQSLDITREGIPRPRIRALSDMIFGLAISIGAWSQLTQKPGSMAVIGYSLLSFGFAFLVLALVWLRYSMVMSVLRIESTALVAANMILLFLVSAEPYLYNLMNISAYVPSPGELNSAYTSAFYALDLGALMIILAFFTHELTKEEKRPVPRELLRSLKLTIYTSIIAAAIFFLSALPVFWSIIVIQSPTVPLRYIMWCGVFVANIGRRLDVRMSSRKARAK